jgi:hypothetical protein
MRGCIHTLLEGGTVLFAPYFVHAHILRVLLEIVLRADWLATYD